MHYLPAVFTTDARRALPLARPKNTTLRAIIRMTDTYFLPGRFVQQEGVSCVSWADIGLAVTAIDACRRSK